MNRPGRKTKLTDRDVEAAREQAAAGSFAVCATARSLGVSIETLKRAVVGESHKHLPDPVPKAAYRAAAVANLKKVQSERAPTARKLTDAQVREIRGECWDCPKGTRAKAAARLRVSRAMVYWILQGKLWKRLLSPEQQRQVPLKLPRERPRAEP